MKLSDLGFEKVVVTPGGKPGYYQRSTGKLLCGSEMFKLLYKVKKEAEFSRNVSGLTRSTDTTLKT